MNTASTEVRQRRLSWPLRRWLVAVASAVLYALVLAVPTDLIDTPLFSRQIPPTSWAWPALALSSALAGLLTATYVATPLAPEQDKNPGRGGYVGGLLTFFAVGCPVCNKLVLLALGTSGAIAWFEPVQPLLQVAAVVVLAWALGARVRGERFCAVRPRAVPPSSPAR
ncbi:MAG TPA: hypothetical protein VK204_01330 [Nocardioidaceae bacterium]|nr:hypothetical protein [Nocardioidaceae bacterium]